LRGGLLSHNSIKGVTGIIGNTGRNKPKGGLLLNKTKYKSVQGKQQTAGWIFLAPATILIFIMSFYPMIRAFIMSLQTGSSANMRWASPSIFNNYTRMFKDNLFKGSLVNTYLYLIIQVPIMLILAILLAQLLNNKDLKFKGLFRTMVFLPCATSLVSYALIFKSLFATQGLVNDVLQKIGITHGNINFLGTTSTAKMVIIIALLWRWTGYNMVFYLAGLQNIEYSVYEAAKIDGANGWKTFWGITVPLLRPTIVMTFIMSINGTLQLFDESVNLTKGGPANSTITMSHYIFNNSFGNGVANFGYASAMSFVVFIMVAILAFINLKVGDTRD
jgi:lactose/L-arabinose transport system permease protein